MGLLDMLKEVFSGKKKTRSRFGGKKHKCPKCKEEITLDMERCPNCGTRISSMFKINCPKCETENSIDAKVCKKCGYNFESAEKESVHQPQYRCPICGYVANFYMLRCPACGTKFAV